MISLGFVPRLQYYFHGKCVHYNLEHVKTKNTSGKTMAKVKI